MTPAEILRHLEDLAARHLEGVGELRSDMRLVEDLGLDSVRLITLLIEAENRFRVRLDVVDGREIATVGDLVGVIARELPGAETEPA